MNQKQELKSKYVSVEDIEVYFPELHFQEIFANDAERNAFIAKWERRISTFIDATFYRNVDNEYRVFSQYQKEHYRYAIMEQIAYVIKNGDISNDSGYSKKDGKIVDSGYIENISVSPNAKKELILCGLWCRKINNAGMGDDWWL